jgi:hypothetical protein
MRTHVLQSKGINVVVLLTQPSLKSGSALCTGTEKRRGGLWCFAELFDACYSKLLTQSFMFCVCAFLVLTYGAEFVNAEPLCSAHV